MTAGGLTLYSYWRSSASYRVRLALAWKQIEYRVMPIDLRANVQSSDDFRARNPQGMVPFLVGGEVALSQSLAIIEYLEDVHPAPPLLPADAIGRAHVRAAAQVIACDTHPINNLRIMRYLKDRLGHSQAEIDVWARNWIDSGMATLEAFAARHGGIFLYGDSVSMADICLLPQLYNARRVNSDLSEFARLLQIESRLLGLDALRAAHPDSQPDAG